MKEFENIVMGKNSIPALSITIRLRPATIASPYVPIPTQLFIFRPSASSSFWLFARMIV